MKSKHKILLLASGGIDSTALLDFYLRRKSKVICIHFQYGQPSAKSELYSIERIADYYEVTLRVIKLPFTIMTKKFEYLCRNVLFVFVGSSCSETPARIALGIHSDSPYYDTSSNFIKDCQQLLDGYYLGTVRVEAPFLNFTKRDIVEYGKKNKVPIELTYSCLVQNSPPCGVCPSCVERRVYIES